MTALWLFAMMLWGAAAAERTDHIPKLDKRGVCFYKLTKEEKRLFPDDECFYQPRGLKGCLPVTCSYLWNRKSKP